MIVCVHVSLCLSLFKFLWKILRKRYFFCKSFSLSKHTWGFFSVCLRTDLIFYICLSVNLSIASHSTSIWLRSLFSFDSLSVHLYQPACLSVALSTYLSIDISINLYICISIDSSFYLSLHPLICLITPLPPPLLHLRIYRLVYLSVYFSIYPSI